MAYQLENEHFPLPDRIALEMLLHTHPLDQARPRAVGGLDGFLEGRGGYVVHVSPPIGLRLQRRPRWSGTGGSTQTPSRTVPPAPWVPPVTQTRVRRGPLMRETAIEATR